MGKVSSNEEEKTLRVWVDGCFDMGHFGHVNLLRQAKETEIVPGMKNHLIVGVHSDEEIARHKRLPIFTESERVEMVRSCKYVDEVVYDAPYITTVATLEKHGCKFTVHGNDLSTSASGVDTYTEVKEADKYFEVERTEGISTTNLIKRILNDKIDAKGYSGGTSVDDNYYTSLMKKIKNVPITDNIDTSKVIYVEGSFDIYHPGHVRFLEEAKAKGTYLVVNIYDDSTVQDLTGHPPYMKLFERALTVMGCRYIDEVIVGGDRGKILPEIQELYENIEVLDGLDTVELGTEKGSDVVTTDQIVQRINDRRDELMSKNAKKEAKEEELAINLMMGVKIV